MNGQGQKIQVLTHPKLNIALEKWWLEVGRQLSYWDPVCFQGLLLSSFQRVQLLAVELLRLSSCKSQEYVGELSATIESHLLLISPRCILCLAYCEWWTVDDGGLFVVFFGQQTSSWNLYVCLYILCESSLWNISWYNLNGHMRRATRHCNTWWGVGLMPCFWWEAMCKLYMQVFDCKVWSWCVQLAMVFPQGGLLLAITCFCFQSAKVSYLSGTNSRGFEGSFDKVFLWFTVKAPRSDRSELRSLIDLQLIWRNGKGKAIVWQLVEAPFVSLKLTTRPWQVGNGRLVSF